MAKKTLVLFALVSAFVLLTPTAGYAQIIPNTVEAWNFSVPGNNFTNGNWTFGEVFVPDRNIQVDYLGYYAANGVGNFLSPHPVGMFDANGVLLGQTVVDNGSTITDFFQPQLNFNPPGGHFVYNPVSPFWLLAGQTYVIEGVSGSDPYTWNDPGFTVYLPLNILGNNWVLNNGLNFNGIGLINDVNDGYWGADFASTPEPATLLLFGSGVLGLAGLVRRKLNL
jgi:PEP-CTERM motif-containing protein